MRTAKTLIRLGGCQADLSFRWPHMPICWFCHEAAQVCLVSEVSFLKYKSSHNKYDFVLK